MRYLPGTMRWWWAAGWVLLIAAFLALRVDLTTQENSMDERIVLSVSKGMSETGQLDPNWAVASPHYYQYPQYNFYSYNILSHFLITATAPPKVQPIVVLRIANVIYQLAALALLILVLRKLQFPPSTIFAAKKNLRTSLRKAAPRRIGSARRSEIRANRLLRFANAGARIDLASA